MILTRRAALPLLLAPLALTSCGGPPPPPPAVLTLLIKAGADQNSEPGGAAAPVAVHVYELTATAKFERADVFALMEREAATLGTEVAASEEFVVTPGQTRTIVRTLKPGVQFIGVAVLFREIDHAHWRVIAPAAASGPTKLTLTTGKLAASLKPT